MKSRKNASTRGLMTVCLAVLLASVAGQPAAARGLQDYVAECGAMAREAGLTGSAMRAFIKQCMAKKQGRDKGDSQGGLSK